MTNSDFLRDGNVGDKVYDPGYGNGVIEHFKESDAQPVAVKFEERDRPEYYYADGKWSATFIHSTLCWGHREPLDRGHPPERFDYPLCTKHKDSSLIVEFTSQRTCTVLVASEMSDPVGTTVDYWLAHTDPEHWKPCDKPVWNPTKPTWCYVGSGAKRLICKVNSEGQYVDAQCNYWTKAEPCEPKDIPDYWPKGWV